MSLAISIVIPCLNSAPTLARCLRAIREQDFPAEDTEILVVDGGSTDDTAQIAKNFGARVIPNPEMQPECAKRIGLLQAAGRLILFVDSDEILDSRHALTERVQAVERHPEVWIWAGAGYRRPPESHWINDYIIAFADPFTHFMYRVSAEKGRYLTDLERFYATKVREPECTLFKVDSESALPLLDLSAGVTLNREPVFRALRDSLGRPDLVPWIAAECLRRSGMLGIMSRQGVYHYCADSLARYLQKIKWRIIMNTFSIREKGAGHLIREEFQPLRFRIKKYLFIPYSLTVVLPLLDGLGKAITTGKPVLLLHPLLCLYTAGQILWFQARKALDLKPVLKSYGSRQA